MSLSIDGARKLLDSMIANKMAYLEKSENNFIKKEVEDLALVNESMKDIHRMMVYQEEQKSQHIKIIKQLQFSYKLLRKIYEVQMLGKLDIDKIQSVEEWKAEFNRLIKTPQNVG